MGLASAMSTALTGLNASETQIDVIGNNLANANTVGFKASDVLFATQFLQTQSVGSAPTRRQRRHQSAADQGLGVVVAEITPNFSQGTISTANSPTDLAIQGDGFFIVQGHNGEQNLHPQRHLHDQRREPTGHRHRQPRDGLRHQQPVPDRYVAPAAAQIPLGTATVAKATTKAYLARRPDARRRHRQHGLDHPDRRAHRRQHEPIRQTGPTAVALADGARPALSGTYQYYVTFSNGNAESRPQLWRPRSPPLDNNQVTLSNIPTDNSGQWTTERIYRSTNDPPGDTNFYLSGRRCRPRPRPRRLHLHRQRHRCHRSATTGQTLNFNGPPVTSHDLLQNVVVYDSYDRHLQQRLSHDGHACSSREARAATR